MPTTIPRIALTPGEPAGIGPDLCVLLAQRAHPAQLVVIADLILLTERAALLGVPLRILPFDPEAPARATPKHALYCWPCPTRQPVVPGALCAANAHYVLETLARACDGCLAGTFDVLVTGPVHKGIINAAGVPFTGHTEFLAVRCRAEPLMLLVAPGLRVALATTHLPLAAVPGALTPARILHALTALDAGLRERFGIAAPRILVCGLNPHAGEDGHLGDEEQRVIAPVVARWRAAGRHALGPVPADTAFLPARLAECDAVLTMYHDQGLPVLKHRAFGQAVNVTLGLPIARVSVDHGTALALAGTGRAAVDSLAAALALALRFARAARR